MKKHLGWALRMLIAAAGVAYILYTLTWTTKVELPDGSALEVSAIDEQWVTLSKPPGSPIGVTVVEGRIERSLLETQDDDKPRLDPSFGVGVRDAEQVYLLAGLGAFAPVFVLSAVRWHVLMRARGIGIHFGRSFRLTMAGMFFNLCMPGTTGGDVMKAFYAAKGTDKRGDAVVSIGVDRVTGLVAQIIFVGTIGLFAMGDPLIRKIVIAMWSGLTLLVVGGAVYTSPTLRAKLRLGRLVGKLPGAGLIAKLDALVAAYRNHLGALATAVAIALPMHVGLASAMALAGFALGVDQSFVYLLGTVPVVLILWSLPISGPLGLGPMDYVAVQLIVGTSGTTPQQALLMFVVYRLYAVAVGLAGALALFGSDAPRGRVPEGDGADASAGDGASAGAPDRA